MRSIRRPDQQSQAKRRTGHSQPFVVLDNQQQLCEAEKSSTRRRRQGAQAAAHSYSSQAKRNQATCSHTCSQQPAAALRGGGEEHRAQTAGRPGCRARTRGWPAPHVAAAAASPPAHPSPPLGSLSPKTLKTLAVPQPCLHLPACSALAHAPLSALGSTWSHARMLAHTSEPSSSAHLPEGKPCLPERQRLRMHGGG